MKEMECMSYKSDLEEYIREAYQLIHEYEEILLLSSEPKEKARARKAIKDQWELIKGYVDEYVVICKQTQTPLSYEVGEMIFHFSQYQNEKLFGIQKPIEYVRKSYDMFISYAQEDEEFCEKLIKQLSVLKWNGLLRTWHYRQIQPGTDWKTEVDTHLNSANIILLLVSADFIASEYCYGVEMKRALERHEAKEAKVIPIILRPVTWKNLSLGKLDALPGNGRFISLWENYDQAFFVVVEEIQKILEKSR